MQEKSFIKHNILQFIDYKGISKYKFYQLCGITRGVLDQNNGMSEENTTKFLAYFPEVNPAWLLTGKGPMLLDEGVLHALPVDQVHDAETKYESQTTIDINHEQVVKQLEEERELLKQSHKEIGILEFKLHSTTTELEKALKEIERLKKMVENVVEPKLMKKQ